MVLGHLNWLVENAFLCPSCITVFLTCAIMNIIGNPKMVLNVTKQIDRINIVLF